MDVSTSGTFGIFGSCATSPEEVYAAAMVLAYYTEAQAVARARQERLDAAARAWADFGEALAHEEARDDATLASAAGAARLGPVRGRGAQSQGEGMHVSYKVFCPAGPTRAQEQAARRRAAEVLGVQTLRGLAQCADCEGTRYYGPGSDDETGESVLIVYGGTP